MNLIFIKRNIKIIITIIIKFSISSIKLKLDNIFHSICLFSSLNKSSQLQEIVLSILHRVIDITLIIIVVKIPFSGIIITGLEKEGTL